MNGFTVHLLSLHSTGNILEHSSIALLSVVGIIIDIFSSYPISLLDGV